MLLEKVEAMIFRLAALNMLRNGSRTEYSEGASPGDALLVLSEKSASTPCSP